MVNSNESINPELKNENPAITKTTKTRLSLDISKLSNNVTQSSYENLHHSTYKVSPKITPRTSHLSLPFPLDHENKSIPKRLRKEDCESLPFFIASSDPKTGTCLSNKKCHSSRMSLPVYLSSALPVSIQNWNDKTKVLLSCNSRLFQKSKNNLELVLDYIWKPSDETQYVLGFVEELFFIHDYFPPVASKLNLSKILTELTYLIYNKPQIVHQILNINNIPQSVEKINYHYNYSLKRVHKLIDHACENQLEKGISNAKKIKHLAIPIAISRILILPVGTMLEELIPSIIEEFVNEDNPYSRSLKAGLQLLYQSDDLKNTIEEICLPKNNLPNSELLIRATLNLSKKTELNNAHAKRAALSALLTHMRQGQNGSCFASFIAIELQSINPQGAILDFKQLLEEGKLIRKINNQLHDFPYLMKIEPLNISSEWKITKLGKIQSVPELYLWELPGIQSLCHYLSIPCEKYILDLLKDLNFEEKTTNLTIDHLIEDLVKQHSCDRKQLEVIFSSHIQHPLLSVWGNSIAGMAEGLNGSMLKSALTQAIYYLVEKAAKIHNCLDLLNTHEILQKIENNVMQRSQYLYDPTYTLKNILKGAFVLYDNHNSKDFTKWTKSGSSVKFLKFLNNILDSAWTSLETTEIALFKDIIFKEISQDAYIIALLKHYHKENRKTPFSADSINFLRYTPWATSIGNDPQMVLKVYHETENIYTIKQLIPKTAVDLLNLLQETLQTIPHDRKKKYLTHGDYILPLRIKGVHIFSLLICHPSMRQFLMSPEKQKFSENLIKSISNFKMTSDIKIAIKAYCHSIVEEKHHTAITEKINSWLKKKPSIQKLRNLLVNFLKEYKPILYREEDLTHEIDLKIFEWLPENVRKEWENSIVHFADTNWQSDIQDIHYGIGVNPGSLTIELLSVLGNGKIHKFLDQSQFLNGKVWEVYLDL